MNFVENAKLRRVFNKGLNFRVTKHRDPDIIIKDIEYSLKQYIENLSKKAKICKEVFSEWYDNILNSVKCNIRNISLSISDNKFVNIFNDREVKSALETLHSAFVCVPTDKSACNISIVCKKFYLESIEKELDSNFEEVNLTKSDILNNHRQFYKDINISFNSKHQKLPMLYATAKQHKIPTKFRYISSTVNCSVKQACVILKHVFKCIQDYVIKQCKYFDGRYKYKIKSCFITDNNFSVRESIFRLNSFPTNVCNLSSFDFDTLYTSLPHIKIKEVLTNIIESVFERVDKEYIRVSYVKAYFSESNKKYGNHSVFNKDQIINLLNFIVDNSYIEYKGKIYRQHTGIPMGIDPAPFMANLFLHHFENKYITSLVDRGDIKEAGVLKYVFRYLDDLFSINDSSYFECVIKDIYPSDLVLSKTNTSSSMTEFLDLDIAIINGRIQCKVYDKRSHFPFKVITFPDIKYGNIPCKPSYGIFFSQILRVLRICNKLEFFVLELDILCKAFLKKGYNKSDLCSIFNKFIFKYVKEWGKFGYNIPVHAYLR